MSFLSDTAKWTKWYSKHAWNPWWLIKEHALSDNAFRDYQAETGGDIKWAKRARNVGRGVAAVLGAYYGAAALGAGAGGGTGGGVAGGTGGEGLSLTASSWLPESEAAIYGSGSNAPLYGGLEGSGAAGGIPWGNYVRMASNMQSMMNQQGGGYQYQEQPTDIAQYPYETPQDMSEVVKSLRERIEALKTRLGEQ